MKSLDEQIRHHENQIVHLEKLRKTLSGKKHLRKNPHPEKKYAKEDPSNLEEIDKKIDETYQHLSVLKIRRMMNL
jgi:hypothetical protein